MQLLNTETMVVEDGFFKDSTPEYAILSHTWGSEEVTLQDMQNHNSNKIHRCYKIRETYKTALKDGCKYA